MTSSLDKLTPIMLTAIETELRRAVARADGPKLRHLYHMLAYHMGWVGEKDDSPPGPEASGKHVRPLMTLLTCAASGGEWPQALPAAAAIELIHNFSLIHDDIEDNSPTRRGRPTLWKLWGIPQAVNTGDALFTLAHLELLKLKESQPPSIILQAAAILQHTCLELTQGQYLDLVYENRTDLSVDDYWPMVGGKTAALLAASTDLGALVAGADESQRLAYRRFGEKLGLAFQTQDDLLGIWGDVNITGKSTASDLLSGKKSLPVLYSLSQNGKFAQRWYRGHIQPQEVKELADQLEREGARDYTQEAARQMTIQALQALDESHPMGITGEALREMAYQLLQRQA